MTVRPLAILAAVVVATPALAHVGTMGHVHGFAAGFAHPLSGLDHLAAMVALGIWAALIGGAAIVVLPVAFPVAMALGGGLALAGVPVPAVEVGIALSSVVLGAAVALRLRPPLAVAVAVAAAFAICHGYAHGLELPAGAGAATFAAGFVLATALLHLVGIAIGLVLGRVADRPAGAALVRAGGGAISLVGAAALLGAV